MKIGVEKRVVLVLPVDLDQSLPDASERGKGNRNPVDHGPTPTGRKNFSADGDLPVHLLDPQPQFLESQIGGGVKDGFNRSLLFPRSNQIAVRALSTHEAEGVDDDGFPRTRFSGQEVEARTELDLGRCDDGEVLYAQDSQHARELTRVAWNNDHTGSLH